MPTETSELSGWHFETDEVSAGVYTCKGVDRQGRYVEAQGSDLDALIERCRKDALALFVREQK
jgi:hypothetical protein